MNEKTKKSPPKEEEPKSTTVNAEEPVENQTFNSQPAPEAGAAGPEQPDTPEQPESEAEKTEPDSESDSGPDEPVKDPDPEPEEKPGSPSLEADNDPEDLRSMNGLPLLGNPEDQLFTIAVDVIDKETGTMGYDLLGYVHGKTPEQVVRMYGAVYPDGINYRTNGQWDPTHNNERLHALVGDAVAEQIKP